MPPPHLYNGIPIFDELARGRAWVSIADRLSSLERFRATVGVTVVNDVVLVSQPGDTTNTQFVADAVYDPKQVEIYINGQRMFRQLDTSGNLQSGHYLQATYTYPSTTDTVSQFTFPAPGPQLDESGNLEVVMTVITGATPSSSGALVTNLPIAGYTRAGAVKVGAGLTIAADGTLTIDSMAGLPNLQLVPNLATYFASSTTYGFVKIGTGLFIDSNGALSVDGNDGVFRRTLGGPTSPGVPAGVPQTVPHNLGTQDIQWAAYRVPDAWSGGYAGPVTAIALGSDFTIQYPTGSTALNSVVVTFTNSGTYRLLGLAA